MKAPSAKSVRDRELRFDELYRSHYVAILRYALRRTTRDEALDIAADTFTVAWQRLDDIPLEPTAWLFVVARNHLLHRSRLNTRRIPTELADDHLVVGDHSETVADVMTALAELSPKDRELLLLVAWDGLAPDQCAAVLGCSKSTFAVRLHRARRRLDRALGPPDGTEA